MHPLKYIVDLAPLCTDNDILIGQMRWFERESCTVRILQKMTVQRLFIASAQICIQINTCKYIQVCIYWLSEKKTLFTLVVRRLQTSTRVYTLYMYIQSCTVNISMGMLGNVNVKQSFCTGIEAESALYNIIRTVCLS